MMLIFEFSQEGQFLNFMDVFIIDTAPHDHMIAGVETDEGMACWGYAKESPAPPPPPRVPDKAAAGGVKEGGEYSRFHADIHFAKYKRVKIDDGTDDENKNMYRKVPQENAKEDPEFKVPK